MTTELKKRTITSIVLFAFAILCISINEIFFLFTCFVVSMICFSEWVRINVKLLNKNRLIYFLITISGFVYLFLIFFVSALFLRDKSLDSVVFFILILCICICSDIGGYVFGKSIGGIKLTKISPNKTIAGSLGSFIFSSIPLFLFNFQKYLNSHFQLDFKTYNSVLTNYPIEYKIINFEISFKNFLFCLIISLSCQLGDLLISYFKRLNNVKDAGTILPGHGGLLDRIDGIIFAIPIAFILVSTQTY